MHEPTVVRRCSTRPIPAGRAEGGFTLIELMVAMLIGMLVVAAALSGYAATGRSGRLQAAHAEMNEGAQIGLALLSRELQLAGYARPIGIVAAAGTGLPSSITRTYMGRAVFGCAHGLNSSSNRSQAAPWDATVCASAASAQDSVIEIVYEADLANSSFTASGIPSDCIGSGLTASEATLDEEAGLVLSYYLTRNRYYLYVGSSGRSELHCASAQGASGQPLVDNVDAMKLWYGEASTTEPGRVARYVRADAVADWDRVLSVQVCLLMRSSEAVLGEDDALDYLDCDGAPGHANDRHARRAYFTTATLRNRMAL